MENSLDPYYRWLGIPPAQQPPNYYRLLGLDLFESNPEVIREAAERQMGHVRHYQLGQHAALCQQLLNELALAKATLVDGARRRAYMATLRQQLMLQAMDTATSPAQTNRPPEEPRFTRPATQVSIGKPLLSSGEPLPTERLTRPQATVLAGLLGAAVAVMSLMALLLWWATSSSDGTILVAIPPHERDGLLIELDTQPVAVAETAELSYPCKPGTHHLRLRRPQFEPFGCPVLVEKGQQVVIRPRWRLLPPAVPIASANPAPPAPPEQMEEEAPRVPEDPDAAIEPVVRIRANLDGYKSRLGFGLVAGPGWVVTTGQLLQGAKSVSIALRDGSSHREPYAPQRRTVPALVLLKLAEGQAPLEAPWSAEEPQVDQPMAVVRPTSAGPAKVTPVVVARHLPQARPPVIELTGSVEADDIGAPVVDAAGQVVGLVARAVNKTTFLAISASEIQAFVQRSQDQESAQMADGDPALWKPTVGPIQFPDGSQFRNNLWEPTLFEVQSIVEATLNGAPSHLSVSHLGNLSEAFLRARNHGTEETLVTFYDAERQHPAHRFSYLNRQRHGPVRAWTSDGQRRFCGEYLEGNRSGIFCLYQAGEPRVVAHFEGDQCTQMVVIDKEKGRRQFSLDTDAEEPRVIRALREFDVVHEELNSLEQLLQRRFQDTLQNLRGKKGRP